MWLAIPFVMVAASLSARNRPSFRSSDRSDGGSPAYTGKKCNQGNAPPFDIRTHLFRMTGVDLTWIDGIDGYTALKVVSEVGTDMTKRENAKRFAS